MKNVHLGAVEETLRNISLDKYEATEEESQDSYNQFIISAVTNLVTAGTLDAILVLERVKFSRSHASRDVISEHTTNNRQLSEQNMTHVIDHTAELAKSAIHSTSHNRRRSISQSLRSFLEAASDSRNEKGRAGGSHHKSKTEKGRQGWSCGGISPDDINWKHCINKLEAWRQLDGDSRRRWDTFVTYARNSVEEDQNCRGMKTPDGKKKFEVILAINYQFK